MKTKCIVILSDKSSGSSALQNLLERCSQVKKVLKTRHVQNETLYWTKAASILGLPQVDMMDSEVPISRQRAEEDLKQFLTDNLPFYSPPDDLRHLIFVGWKLLCQQYSPIFLEKSPHHLHQWSALKLIAECVQRTSEIDFLIIGLIRNPMDTLYSHWRRWKTFPEKNQYQWKNAYKNLIKFRDLVGDKLVTIRYEDMVTDISSLEKIFAFIGDTYNHDNVFLHTSSIGKWKKDKFYGFNLAQDVMLLAEKYGYKKNDLQNNNKSFVWPIYRQIVRTVYKLQSHYRLP